LKAKYEHLFKDDNIDLKDPIVMKDREKRAKSLVENEALESEIENFAIGGISTGERVELYMKYFGIENST
jgi:hypothetical protein